jgi:hypothetical protein
MSMINSNCKNIINDNLQQIDYLEKIKEKLSKEKQLKELTNPPLSLANTNKTNSQINNITLTCRELTEDIQPLYNESEKPEQQIPFLNNTDNILREIQQEAQQETQQKAQQEAQQETQQETQQEAQQETQQSIQQETQKETQQETILEINNSIKTETTKVKDTKSKLNFDKINKINKSYEDNTTNITEEALTEKINTLVKRVNSKIETEISKELFTFTKLISENKDNTSSLNIIGAFILNKIDKLVGV